MFLFLFLFACIINLQAITPQLKQQPQPKDCIKHPQIVKMRVAEKSKPMVEKVVPAVPVSKGGNAVPYFSVLNFINFFYSKDTLDNLRVM